MEKVPIISHAAAAETFGRYATDRQAIRYIATSSVELLATVLAAQPTGKESVHKSLFRRSRRVTAGPYLGEEPKPDGTSYIVGLWEENRSWQTADSRWPGHALAAFSDILAQKVNIRAIGSLPVRSVLWTTLGIINRLPLLPNVTLAIPGTAEADPPRRAA